ncbi:hypothetical protein CDD80_544 [Ophiocordyceps camponoti-rufipedis]|uniref:Uncharacterized protein n=1 Tax=Ophiocordyceps camponoti-rufipedis TaxID=2004952 RepID=A0A2C5ZCF2_9HYPO|nr:hypothetical protein CDD80_544 [Ophiocordyceps camponoti-rufipedis]
MKAIFTVFTAFAGVALANKTTSVKVVILADTNRDGKVDEADGISGKETWTSESGAIFLPNIVDTYAHLA